MGSDSNPKQLTASATTTIGSVFLYGICINKVLTGTITVKDGTSVVGTIAASTVAGMFFAVPNGIRFTNLVIILSAADDATCFTRVA